MSKNRLVLVLSMLAAAMFLAAGALHFVNQREIDWVNGAMAVSVAGMGWFFNRHYPRKPPPKVDR